MQHIGQLVRVHIGLGTFKGKSFNTSKTRRLIHGNEEEGHQKGCQEEKEVSDRVEA
jgi:hypothetical protein